MRIINGLSVMLPLLGSIGRVSGVAHALAAPAPRAEVQEPVYFLKNEKRDKGSTLAVRQSDRGPIIGGLPNVNADVGVNIGGGEGPRGGGGGEGPGGNQGGSTPGDDSLTDTDTTPDPRPQPGPAPDSPVNQGGESGGPSTNRITIFADPTTIVAGSAETAYTTAIVRPIRDEEEEGNSTEDEDGSEDLLSSVSEEIDRFTRTRTRDDDDETTPTPSPTTTESDSDDETTPAPTRTRTSEPEPTETEDEEEDTEEEEEIPDDDETTTTEEPTTTTSSSTSSTSTSSAETTDEPEPTEAEPTEAPTEPTETETDADPTSTADPETTTSPVVIPTGGPDNSTSTDVPPPVTTTDINTEEPITTTPPPVETTTPPPAGNDTSTAEPPISETTDLPPDTVTTIPPPINTGKPDNETDTTVPPLTSTDEVTTTPPPTTTLPPTTTRTGLSVPETLIVESPTVNPEETVTSTATGVPSELPPLVVGPSGIPSSPPDFIKIRLAIGKPFDYKYVAEHPVAIAQIFEFVPKGLSHALEINIDQIIMRNLAPFDTVKTKGYVTTLVYAFIPKSQLDKLRSMIIVPSSRLYNHPTPGVQDLMRLIDASVDPIAPLDRPASNDENIGGNNAGDNWLNEGVGGDTDGSNNGGAPIGGDSSSASNEGGAPSKPAIGIAVGVVIGAAAYGAAMFFVARRYKKRRGRHGRVGSIDRSLSPGSNPAGALMAGAYEGSEKRDSRGSGSGSAMGPISAPVHTNNSLGWN